MSGEATRQKYEVTPIRIGPGAESKHIKPRLEPHARAAISAISSML